MTIELDERQASLVCSTLANAMDEVLSCISKEYRKGRRDYVKILEKEFEDYREIINKFQNN